MKCIVDWEYQRHRGDVAEQMNASGAVDSYSATPDWRLRASHDSFGCGRFKRLHNLHNRWGRILTGRSALAPLDEPWGAGVMAGWEVNICEHGV